MATQEIASDVADQYLKLNQMGIASISKNQYALNHMLADVVGPGLTEDIAKAVWFAIADFIVEMLSKKKGVIIPHLATFSIFKKTFEKVFRPAATFKSELSCMLAPKAPEVPCLQLPLTAIAIKAAVAQEKVEAVLKRAILQLGHQARNGATLAVTFGGLGMFWSRSNSFGFNFNRKPQKVEERKLTLKERALRKKAAAEEAERLAQAQAEFEAEENETIRQNSNQDASGVPSTEPDALDQALEEQLDQQALRGPEQLNMDEIMEKYHKESPANVAQTIAQRKAQKAIEENEYRCKNHLPAFLIPDRHRGRQFNVEQCAANEQLVENLFKEELAKDEELATRQKEQILLRHQRAELEHRAKILRKKRQQKEVLADMAQQAEERRKRDFEADQRRRLMVNPDPSRSIPQQRDPDRKVITKIQGELRQLLDHQVLEKKIAQRIEKKKTVQQERYFLDSLHRQLVQDRNFRHKEKMRVNENLRSEWTKATEYAKKNEQVRKSMYLQ